MSRAVIRLGDDTSHGGKVITASARMTIDGIPVALWGDRCSCPHDGHDNCVICEGEPGAMFDGIPVALEGHKTDCGATLLASQLTRCNVSPLVKVAKAPRVPAAKNATALPEGMGFAEIKQHDKDSVSYGAWIAENTWNDDWVEKYRSYAPGRAKYYCAQGSESVCEDFVLQILIDFAYENHLPVSIRNGIGIQSSNDLKWNLNKEAFVHAVKDSTGASDLSTGSNSLAVSSFNPGDLGQLKFAKPGDLFFFRYTSGRVHHVAMICEIHDGYLRFTEGQQTLGTSDSDSILYGGKRVKGATLNTNNGDIWIDEDSPEKLRKARFQFKQVEIRTWNFLEWKE